MYVFFISEDDKSFHPSEQSLQEILQGPPLKSSAQAPPPFPVVTSKVSFTFRIILFSK